MGHGGGIMRVAFLSAKHPPLDKRVFDKEAVSLVHAGFKVTHIAPGEGKTFVKDGVEIILFPPPKRLIDRILQIPRLYRLAVRLDADCYHCNEVDSWVVGVLLKIFRRKFCVFDVHEHYPSTFAESRFPSWLRPYVINLVRLVYRILLPFTDKIVLAKKSVSADFHCANRKKVLVRNFTPLNAATKHKASKQPSDKSFGNPLEVIHTGLISRLRGWPQILESMKVADNQNIHLTIIGTFNDGSKADFERTAATYGLSSRIRLFDWMPYNELFEQLLRCDVGLVTFQPGVQNHVFAMPHKMFDYMLAGLAIIIPKFAMEVAPVVQDRNCGLLVDPSDPEELANGLDYMADHREECRRMGQRGKQAVLDEYNWEREAERLIETYRDLQSKL